MRRRKQARSIINFKSLRQHSIRLLYRSEMLQGKHGSETNFCSTLEQGAIADVPGKPHTLEVSTVRTHLLALLRPALGVCQGLHFPKFLGRILPPSPPRTHTFFLQSGILIRALSPPLNQREIFGGNLERFSSKDCAFCRLLLPKLLFAPVIIKWM